jgi:hypothetical protein
MSPLSLQGEGPGGEGAYSQALESLTPNPLAPKGARGER